MDPFNQSFEWQGSSAVQVLDSNDMEYDYENSSDPSYLQLQNEILLENPNDQYNQFESFEIPDDISSIPSYGSFVKNLTRSQNDSFENVTNSTTIEDISAPDMSAKIMNKCAFNCTCESCLPMYDHNETEEPMNVTMWEDITNNKLFSGDLTYILNQTDSTAYMALPPIISTPNESVKLGLRNKILAKSNAEANANTGSSFYSVSSNS